MSGDNFFEFTVPTEVKEERMNICRSCEHLVSFDRCKLCGCFMQYKTMIPGVRCPINKWKTYKQEEKEDGQ